MHECRNSRGNVAAEYKGRWGGSASRTFEARDGREEATGTYLCRSWKHSLPTSPGHQNPTSRSKPQTPNPNPKPKTQTPNPKPKPQTPTGPSNHPPTPTKP